MSIKLFADNNEIKLEQSTFPGGESFIKIADTRRHGVSLIEITLNFETNSDIINLMLLMDACKRHYREPFYKLKMPYLPYARQDRVMTYGESLSVKVICDIINSLKFDEVVVKDIHSDVGVALLNNLNHLSLNICAGHLSGFNKVDTILVSPDVGANKKVLAFAKEYCFKNVVRADKTRDVATGKITGTVVYSENVGDKDFLILDDLLDGGYTFIELAKQLRKLTTGKVMLYITHGLFSKGIEVFDGYIDKIYVSNLMNNNVVTGSDKLVQII